MMMVMLCRTPPGPCRFAVILSKNHRSTMLACSARFLLLKEEAKCSICWEPSNRPTCRGSREQISNDDVRQRW